MFLGLGGLPSLVFSFLLQLVLMSGAIVRAIWHLACAPQVEWFPVVAGMTSSAVLLALILGAFVAYRLLLLVVRLVQRNCLWPLSVYLFALSGIWVILNLP